MSGIILSIYCFFTRILIIHPPYYTVLIYGMHQSKKYIHTVPNCKQSVSSMVGDVQRKMQTPRQVLSGGWVRYYKVGTTGQVLPAPSREDIPLLGFAVTLATPPLQVFGYLFWFIVPNHPLGGR